MNALVIVFLSLQTFAVGTANGMAYIQSTDKAATDNDWLERFNFPEEEITDTERLALEAELLPPPLEVQKILDGQTLMAADFMVPGTDAAPCDSKQKKQRIIDAVCRWKTVQFDPVVAWLLKAITSAHQSEKICEVERQVLSTGVFTRNLSAACNKRGLWGKAGEIRSAFDDLIAGVSAKRNHYGAQMNAIYNEMNLDVELGHSTSCYKTSFPLFSKWRSI